MAISLIDKSARKRVFIETVNSNDFFTIKILSSICLKSERQIESYLYDANRFPDYFDLYSTYRFVVTAKGNIPIELRKFIYALLNQWKKGKSFIKDELLDCDRRWHAAQYIYHNESLAVTEIALKANVKLVTTQRRLEIANSKPGDDVTDIIDNPIKPGRQKKWT